MATISKFKLKLKHIHRKIESSETNKNRIGILTLLALLITSWTFSQVVKVHAANPAKIQEGIPTQIQEGIAKEIIRFHVIANSDSDEDQDLKYLVKNSLVQFLQPHLKDVKDVEEAQEIIIDMLPLIQNMASHVIEEKGYKYDVTASLSATYFPMKVYGDYTFPPGQYEALQVQIGNSEGRNWWCVMFPPLCFVDETYSIVDEDGKEKLKHLLTEEEFEALKGKQLPIKVRFKIFESIKKLFSLG